jgi:hypothetical protein
MVGDLEVDPTTLPPQDRAARHRAYAEEVVADGVLGLVLRASGVPARGHFGDSRAAWSGSAVACDHRER